MSTQNPSTETPAPAPETPSADTPAATEPQEPNTTPAADEPSGDTPPWGDDFDAERAWKRIQAQKADLDAERAKRAQAVKDAETAAEKRAAEKAYKEIGKTLGVVAEDETPTVEGLSQALQDKDATLTSAQAENIALRTENAVLRHADALGADAGILLRLEDVKTALAALDSTADNYASEVERTVKEAVENNPFVRKVQVATSNSNGQHTPTGERTPSDDTSIEGLAKRRAERRKNRL